MTRCKRRRSDRSGRAPLPSPGRPPVAGRDELRRLWAGIALGLSSEDAGAGANVPQAVGARWFRKAGGMSPAMFGTSARPLEGKRVEFLHEVVQKAGTIALLVDPNFPSAATQTLAMRQAARSLGLNLPVVTAGTERDIDTAFATLVRERAGSLAVAASGFFFFHRDHP